MKRILFSFFLMINLFASAQDFQQYFTDGSLRIDFLLFGNKDTTQASIKQLKKEPFYGGSKKNLIFPNFGTYKFVVKDADKGNIIFSKGFSPIFQEWKHTPEAKEKILTFENVMKIPYPIVDIIVEIHERNANGEFNKVFSEKISPKDYQILHEATTNYKVTEIYKPTTPEKGIDIAIVAEGYTQSEMPKFIANTKRLVDYMFTIPPFSRFKDKFNIYAIESPSQESGTDIGGEGIYKNTILNTKFYTFGSPRYLTCQSLFKLADITSVVPYDQVYVIVNTPRYGGGGFYNVINLVSADDKLSDKVFVHEFGHGFVGLADEYYYDGDILDNTFYNYKIEPWEANITTLVNFKAKWADLVSKKTPIPTPRIPKFRNNVGAFEGGGYSSKGIFSPVQDCRMKSNEPEGFCPVCTRAIEQVIEFYTN